MKIYAHQKKEVLIMAEYIDREKVLNLFDKVGCYLNPKCLEWQKQQIEQLPTADVVEVVRCKDCKFYKLRNVSSRYKPTKPCCLRTATIKVKETDFCSYGEKRSEENGKM